MRYPILSLLLMTFYATISAKDIQFMTENTPPYSYLVEGVPKGIFVDIVRELMQQTGHPDNIEVLPWNRAYYKMTNVDGSMALFAMLRTKEREALFQWVCPLSDKSTYFFKKRDSNITIHNLDEARQVEQIGTVRGWAAQKKLESLGFQNIVPTESVHSHYQNLMKGRLDLITASPGAIRKSAIQYGIDPEEFENTGVLLEKTDLCIAFTHAVPSSRVAKWQKALDRFNRSGNKRQEIVKRYGF